VEEKYNFVEEVQVTVNSPWGISQVGINQNNDFLANSPGELCKGLR
jgi:hypothetical protein